MSDKRSDHQLRRPNGATASAVFGACSNVQGLNGSQLFATSSQHHGADAFADEDNDIPANTNSRAEFGGGDQLAGDRATDARAETESVVQEGRQLLLQFIMTEMQRERRRLARQAGSDAGPSTSQNRGYMVDQWDDQAEDVNDSGSVSVGVVRHAGQMMGISQQDRHIVDALKRIGDAMDADHELNSLIGCLPPEANWATFARVARDLFSHEISWGRIVALFYFALRLVKRDISGIPGISYVETMASTPMISNVLNLAGKVIKLYLAQWIIRRGGWGAVMEWFGPAWSQIGVAFGIAVIVVGFMWKGRTGV